MCLWVVLSHTWIMDMNSVRMKRNAIFVEALWAGSDASGIRVSVRVLGTSNRSVIGGGELMAMPALANSIALHCVRQLLNWQPAASERRTRSVTSTLHKP